MMHRIIILLSILNLSINYSFAQNNSDPSEILLDLEKQYFATTNEAIRTKIGLQKMNVYINHHLEQEESCYEECKRVNGMFLSDMREKETFYWNAAIVNMLHHDFNSCREMLRMYKLLHPDTSVAFGLLAIISNVESEEQDSMLVASYPQLNEISACLKQEKMDSKHLSKKYNWTSYIVPGAGMMLKGYYSKGMTAFLVNTGSGALVYYLLRKSAYANAVGIALLTVAKFYQGNIAYTKKLVPKRFHRKQTIKMNECHLHLENLVKTNPINFK